jgi:hypothetical protein
MSTMMKANEGWIKLKLSFEAYTRDTYLARRTSSSDLIWWSTTAIGPSQLDPPSHPVCGISSKLHSIVPHCKMLYRGFLSCEGVLSIVIIIVVVKKY